LIKTDKISSILLLLFFALFSFNSYADTSEILRFPPGDVITLEEAQRFKLFENQIDFTHASIKEIDEKLGGLEVFSVVDGNEIVKEFVFPIEVIAVLNDILELEFGPEKDENVLSKYICKIATKEMTITGELLRWTGDGIEVKVEFGNFTIPIDKIISIKHKESQEYEQKFGFVKDPNQTRLFFAPTGRTLKKGNGYFSVYEVIFPDVNYAIMDNISIGGGIFPFSTSEFQLFWFTPKVGLIQQENFALSAGLLHFQIHEDFDTFDESDSMRVDEEPSDPLESFGIVYGVGTYGNRDYAVTLGVGFAYGEDAGNRPAIMLGGEYRLTESTKLISENWIIPNMDQPIGLLGIRWFGKKMAVDFALGRFSGLEILAIPWVDFVINF
jgi:hypothetical protein